MAIPGLRITAKFAVLLGFLNFTPIGGQSRLKSVVPMTRSDILAASICGGCTLLPKTTNIAALGGDPGATSPNSYVLFTAYEIKSTYVSQGICITTSGSQTLMEPYFSINKPPSADPTAFQSSASTKFTDYLGFSTCAPGVNAMVLIPIDSALPSSSSVSSPSDASSSSVNSSNTLVLTTPSTIITTTTLPSPTLNRPSSSISTGAKVAIGAVIPVIGIVFFSFVMIYLWQWRKRKRSQCTKSKKNTSDSSDDTQPYLQQKAELDSEERRQLELDAQELRYEMDGAEGRYEIEGGDGPHEVPAERRRQGLLSLGQIHELRGEEHSKELEGPELL